MNLKDLEIELEDLKEDHRVLTERLSGLSKLVADKLREKLK